MLGTRPTPISVADLLRAGTNVPQVLTEAMQQDNAGNIMAHVVTNPATRSKVVDYFASNVDQAVDQMLASDDPRLGALASLAEEPKLHDQILQAVGRSLKKSARALPVLLKLGTDKKLSDSDAKAFAPEVAGYCGRHSVYNVAVLASLVLVHMLPAAEPELEAFVTSELKKDSPEAVAKAFALVSVALSLDPSFGAKLFMLPAVQESNVAYFSNQQVLLNCLDMLSSACSQKDLRPVVAKNFGKLVDTAASAQDKETKLLASAVQVKLLAGMATDKTPQQAAARIDELSVVFENYLEASGRDAAPRELHTALEALAATSLLPSVKLRANAALVAKLSEYSRTVELAFGALFVLANLTAYPYKETKEQQKVQELRAAAGPSPFETQPKLTPAQVGKIVDLVLEAKTVEWLAQGSSAYGLRAREQTVVLVRNLACPQEQARRIELASQGGVVVALYLWVCDKPGQQLSAELKAVAGSAIAKTLANIPPSVAFNDRFDATTVVEPLRAQIYNPASERKNLDTFEALMALTNLASVGNEKLSALIAHKCWTKIEEALHTEYAQIQVAAFELMCNLMTVSAGAAPFLQRNDHSDALISLLAQGLNMSDHQGRVAAGGALAMLAEWEGAPEAIGHNKDMITNMTTALEHDDPEELLRVLTAIYVVVKGTLKTQDDEVAEGIIYYGGVSRMEALVEKISPDQHEIVTVLLKLIRILSKYKIRKA